MFFFIPKLTKSVEYSLSLTELTISGSGKILKQEIRTNSGSYTEITKIFIKDGPTEIGDGSFNSFNSLSYIEIPGSVTKIGESVFRMCNNLKTIKVLSGNSFYSENNILYTFDKKKIIRFPITKNIQIPYNVEEILNDAFSTGNRFNYGNIVFPASVKKLYGTTFDSGKYESITFGSGSNLTNFKGLVYATVGTITIPKSVTRIEPYAMLYASIENLVFEENSQLETLDKYSFNLLYISVVNLPESILSISELAFSDSTVKTISIGSKCANISVAAFSNCKQLSQINIAQDNSHYGSYDGNLMNNGMTEIIFIPTGKTTISIPQTTNVIGVTALQNSGMLKSIELNGNTNWKTISGVLYSSDFQHLIAVCGGVSSVEVHQDVIKIDDYAASGCKLLTSVTFNGDKVKEIGEFAFDSTELTSFTLPNSVTNIYSSAFISTSKMLTFTVNESAKLEKIYEKSFYNSAIGSFNFIKSVNFIGEGAFHCCSNLKSINFHPEINIASVGIYSFQETPIEELNVPSSLTSISERCFKKCNSLKSVVCTETSKLSSIKDDAFSWCDKLEKVILSNLCNEIGFQSFIGCSSLVTFTHNLTTINNAAFDSCTSLECFNFSVNQVKPNPSIFKNCVNLKEFNVASGNTNIKSSSGIVFDSDEKILIMFPSGQEMATIPTRTEMFADNAFAWSAKLKYVVFNVGSNLDGIGRFAFFQCKKLESVQFPPRLQKLEEGSFSGCVSLKTITLPSSLTTIEPEAFIGCNLRTVKYCGVNIVSGNNVFEKSVKILVTDLYNDATFCSNKVYKKLSVDCELKEQFIPTCRYSRISTIPSHSLFAFILFSPYF